MQKSNSHTQQGISKMIANKENIKKKLKRDDTDVYQKKQNLANRYEKLVGKLMEQSQTKIRQQDEQN